MHLPAVVLMSAENLLAQAVRLDPSSADCFAALADKVVRVQVQPPDISFYLLPHAQGISLLSHYEGEFDVSVRGAPFSLLHLLKTQDKRLLSNGEVLVEGDNAVLLRLSACLKNLEIDWEEQFARLIGDIPAHWLGFKLRRLRAWGQRHSAQFIEHLSEYSQEELRVLPSAPEVQAFLDDVDTLRDDAECLAQRIQRLQEKNAKPKE
jgi:ubiquinone biosynthesis accessory factor UbiJ